MAFRWLARRLLNSFRSPMIWSNARRCSSRARRRRSSVFTWARKRLSAVAVAPGSVTVASRSSVTISDIAIRSSPRSVLRLLPQALQLLFQGDHLQLAPDHHLLKLLEVQDLFLQLGLGLLEVAHHLLVGAHVAQDADGADDLAVGVAEGGGVGVRRAASPLALRGLSRALRVTPRSTTSRRAAVNSRVSWGLMKRESDCSRSSSGRKPRSVDTASLACRILPSRSETNTGSGAFLIKLSA